MNPSSLHKYRPFPPVHLPDRTWPDRRLERAPIWCSVDLRDGNQALPIPMSVEEKIEMFDLLVRIGFKQIEVGFPSAADTEFNFLRRLADENRIPPDVTVQVLVQAREHLIRRTFEALEGIPRAIVHLYNSTSPLQRRVTFRDASREEIKKIATEGTALVKELAGRVPPSQRIDFQYSPESFSDTELDFSLEVCEAVKAIWRPTRDQPMILNLPATVEWSTPNVHADQIEWFCRQISHRDTVIISLHTHNDRGTGIAATELGLLAGADRVEGTLFGNGERTGNLDLVVVALNLNSHGIETGLDFSDLPAIRAVYERCTRMTVPERQPYAGELVFTAFSGSHQDAIKKGFDRRSAELADNPHLAWGVPYLTIDPRDIGRSYEAIIRINSQSGRGGVAYVLDRDHGLDLPKTMHHQVGHAIYSHADRLGRELSSDEIREYFHEHFVNLNEPFALLDFELNHHGPGKPGEVRCQATFRAHGKTLQLSGTGNGPINALVRALEAVGLKTFHVTDYRSHAVRGGSDADSAAFVQLNQTETGDLVWGCGIDPSIEMAGLRALVSAMNLLASGERLGA
ncbi:MAG: 2-isopropylmalate synthase [Verrucomicrobia bacterium]|nr:MAG: 2-isopropylmalate synthase [Verrucomicrobiota bacterium]